MPTRECLLKYMEKEIQKRKMIKIRSNKIKGFQLILKTKFYLYSNPFSIFQKVEYLIYYFIMPSFNQFLFFSGGK